MSEAGWLREAGAAGGQSRRFLLGALVAAAVALAVPGSALAVTYSPVNTPGAALSVPRAQLSDALRCTAGVSGAAKREAVLMVPGTTLSPDVNFSWNWLRALSAQGIPYCTIRSPGDAMADIQDNGEYLVYAIREMHRRTHRKVQVVGYSQGGMVPRWALRFWPDTRAMVDDVVGLSPSNHGTLDAVALCSVGCAPAIFQQVTDSKFNQALNSRQETFRGIDYTVAYSHTDEVVVPNTDEGAGSSPLRTGDGARANIATQQICPANVADHLAMGSYDPVAYAIAIDALSHPGPAVASRVDRSVCTRLTQPGVNQATFATDYAAYAAYIARVLATYPHVSSEPPLRCYVTASCPGQGTMAGGSCLNSRGGVKGTRLGPAVLGRTVRVQRRHLRGKRLRTRAHMDRYCATGGGSFRIGYPTGRLARAVRAAERRRVRGRAVLILTSSRRFSVAGIKPGDRMSRLRRRLRHERTQRVGKNTWYVAPARHARLIYRVRGSRVLAVGIADKRLSATTSGRRRLLTAWKLQ
jgi:triacylglycerol esterase/lipase EstA (alpha/beta hydrolase family)